MSPRDTRSQRKRERAQPRRPTRRMGRCATAAAARCERRKSAGNLTNEAAVASHTPEDQLGRRLHRGHVQERPEATMSWTVACFCGNVYAAPPDRCEVCGCSIEHAMSGHARSSQLENAGDLHRVAAKRSPSPPPPTFAQPTMSEGHRMSTEDNKAVVVRWFTDFWGRASTRESSTSSPRPTSTLSTRCTSRCVAGTRCASSR